MTPPPDDAAGVTRAEDHGVALLFICVVM
jgi:hypothetical protein